MPLAEDELVSAKKTSWGVPTVPDRVGRGKKEAVDGGSRQKKMKPKK